jgi:plastin-1
VATDRDIIDWANSRVQGAGKQSRMSSFRDHALADSHFFLHLLGALAPGVVNPEIVTEGSTDEEKASNAKYVISIARKIGATVFLTYEDIVEVKSKMILVLTASLMAWDRSAPGKAL